MRTKFSLETPKGIDHLLAPDRATVGLGEHTDIAKGNTLFELKNDVFWDATPCGSCKNRRFGGTAPPSSG
jgi:hypothetical protein